MADLGDLELRRSGMETEPPPPRRSGLIAAALIGAVILAVAAWYFWLFPNLMLNFYPWGLSVNEVITWGNNLIYLTRAEYDNLVTKQHG